MPFWSGVAGGLALVCNTALAAPPIAGDDFATTRSGPTAGLEVFLNLAANDSDPDGDTLTFDLSVAPGSGTAVVGPSGTSRYTPNPGFAGTDTYQYLVDDGTGGTAVGTVTITVVATQNPVALDDTASVGPWPAQTEIRLLDNDSDADGDVLAYRDVVIVSSPQNGFLEFSCLGACTPPTYRPNNGFAGTDTFTYQALDPLGGASNVATVTITVAGPPIAVDDAGDSLNGQPVLVDVLANDTDPNGDTLSAVLQTAPSGGTAQVTAGGILYTPNAGFLGPDSFTYVASDGVLQSAPATVTIAFGFVAQPPTAVDDTATTVADTPVLIDVLANDTDPDNVNADLSVAGVTQPANGAVVIQGRQVEYTPDAGYVGTDTFTYDVTDMVDGSDTGTVTVTVVAGNQPPVAVIAGGNRTVADSDGVPGERVVVDGSGSSDPDGTVGFYEWTVNGVVADVASTATPTFDLPDGTNTISLRVFDDSETASTPATVTITVATNVPPVAAITGGNRAVPDTDQRPGEQVAVDGSGSSDADGTIATYQWSVNGQPAAGSAGPRPTLSLADGPNTVALVVVDGAGAASSSTSVVITVAAPASGPVVAIAGGDRQIPDGDNVPGELVPFEGSATTPGGGAIDANTFRWSVNGAAVPGASGQARPTLALDEGANVVTLTAADAQGATGSDTVTVTIGAPNQISDLPDLTDNQRSTANAAESVCSSLAKSDPSALTEEQRNLRATCDTLFAADATPEAAGRALDQISGEQVTSQQTTAIDFSTAQMLNVGARLRALRMGAKGFSSSGLNLSSPDLGAPVSALASLGRVLLGEGGAAGDDEGGLLDSRLGIFVNGSVRWGTKDATTRESGFDFDTQGVTIGADYRFSDTFVAGLALGYANGTADFDDRAGEQDSSGYTGSAYTSWYDDDGYVDGIVSVGTIDYDSVRNITLAGVDIVDTALGETSGTQWAMGLGGGYDLGTGALRFGPTGSISYVRVDIDGFTERTTGTSGLAMKFADQNADSMQVKLGGQVSYQLARKWGILSPQARFDVVRELMNDAERVTVRFANGAPTPGPGSPGDSFVVYTDNPDRNFFNWAVGLAATFANGLSGFVDYESVAGLDTITSEELSFGLRYEASFR